MSGIAGLSEAAQAEIGRRSNQFRAALQSGDAVRIESYLDGFDETDAARRQLLSRLLTLEVDARRSAGEAPDVSSYRRRFPNDQDIIGEIIEDHSFTVSRVENERTTTMQTRRESEAGGPGSDPGGDRVGTPAKIGKYRVIREIGEGGFGVVYLAWHPQLQKEVAIKCPRAGTRFNSADEERFALEARRIASLKHPGIVSVFDFDTAEGRPFFVQEYIRGSDLRRLIQRGPLEIARATSLLREAAEAIAHAHERGLYHRDLKPGNILLDGDGRAIVCDFGLAIQADARGRFSAQRCGTPQYMAPEQVRGEAHLVDGRSDIWSLGVIFYQMLTGCQPFTAADWESLQDEILYADPRPLREVRPLVPVELERICERCLCKRMSDRYTTARDLVADLDNWLARPDAATDAPKASRPPSIVPKGIQAYSEQDADFYLELLPGPWDRNGLPLSIREWKQRIEQTDCDRTFSIGVVYGPSGSGKSSFVNAGLLPQLSHDLLIISVEATGEDVVAAIRNELAKALPSISPAMPLAECFAGLRNQRWTDRKVLVVIDQFEQWLHRVSQSDRSPLIEALRQCDGGHLQTMVLVRDDFWMGVTQFLRELDAPHTFSAAVDRFSLRHAREVLARFGQAYGVLPEDRNAFSEGQLAFLEQSIDSLSEEDAVTCVHLAIFAEMLKDQPWVPATLKRAGGSSGVGESFLHASFSSTSAPPRQRLYAFRAQRVLEQLLPEPGVDIKGHTRSRADLQAAADLVGRDAEFTELLSILDGDLHLITPADTSSDSATAATNDAHYQLTHDYLIPSLRTWIQRQQQQTWAGKAELRLVERTALWSSVAERKQLPSLWEWSMIRLLTSPRRWSKKQAEMMKAAGWHHLLRISVAAGLLMIVAAAVAAMESQRSRRQQARQISSLVDQLWRVDLQHFGGVAEQLRAGPDGWRSTVQDIADDPDRPTEVRTRAHLALTDNRPASVGFLSDRLLTADRDEYVVIAEQLRTAKGESELPFWEALRSDRSDPEKVVRAAAYLAQSDPHHKAWDDVGEKLLSSLVREDPLELRLWVTRLYPVRQHLLPPLLKAFDDPQWSASHRQLLASILAEYSYQDDQWIPPTKLVDLTLGADRGQFEILFRRLTRLDRSDLISQLKRRLAPTASNDNVREAADTTPLRANAAEILLRLGQQSLVLPWLKHSADPRLRTALVDRLHRSPIDWIDTLAGQQDPGVRQALILASVRDRSEISEHDLESLDELLLRIFQTDPDPGVHSAAEWVLTQAGYQQELHAIRDQLAGSRMPDRRWYVNDHGHTMMITSMPAQAEITKDAGSPDDGTRRSSNDVAGEPPQRRLAIGAREVTVEQYLQFSAEFDYDQQISPQADCPINHINCYDAMKYCRWLSEQEGIEESEMCYPPVEQIGPMMQLSPELAQKTGYRLPTVGEWEHIAGGLSRTLRFYGNAPESLERYAWFGANSDGRLHPVGLLVPNQTGLFDVYGNVREWCHPQAISDDVPEVRGGGYRDIPDFLVTARSGPMAKHQKFSTNGFRIARTIK